MHLRMRIRAVMALIAVLAAFLPATAASAAPNPSSVFDGNVATTERVDAASADAAALAISRARFTADAAVHVVLSRNDVFADSLVGAPLTAAGPLLLTTPAALTGAVKTELDRVLVPGATVYLLGGSSALSGGVEQAVAAAGYTPVRLSGPSRVETSVAVAREVRRLNPGVTRVALARQNDWADSVTGGAWATDRGVALMVTDSTSVHPAIAAALREFAPSQTVLLGGQSALSGDVAAAVPAPLRVAGASRSETATEIAKVLWAGTPTRYIAFNGFAADGWGYGLAAAGLAADNDAPLLVTTASAATTSSATFDRAGCSQPADVVIVGSTASVGADIAERFACGSSTPGPGTGPMPAPPVKATNLCGAFTDAQAAELLGAKVVEKVYDKTDEQYGNTDNCHWRAGSGVYLMARQMNAESYELSKNAIGESEPIVVYRDVGREAFLWDAAEMYVKVDGHTVKVTLRSATASTQATKDLLVRHTRTAIALRY